MIDIDKEIIRTVKTGKVIIGHKNTLKTLREGKARLVIIANSCPENSKREIEFYSKLSEIPVIKYDGSGKDLGAIINKPFSISTLTVREVGDSKIMKAVERSE